MSLKQQKIFITFFLSKKRLNVDGLAPIVCRVSLNGKRWDVRLGVNIGIHEWHEASSRVKGSSAVSKKVNARLEKFEDDCILVFNRLVEMYPEVTLDLLKSSFDNMTRTHPEQVVAFWRKEVEKMTALIGKEYSAGTVNHYRAHCNIFEKYLQTKRFKDDISLKEIDPYFIEQFNFYLRTEKRYCKNTASKYQRNLSKILSIALKYELIPKNPFEHIVLGYEEVDRPYLNEEELGVLVNAEFTSKTFSKVRDFFVFSCFTGLAYVDLLNLQKRHLISVNNKLWIKTRRQKTKTQSNIHVLDVPMKILESYNSLETLDDKDCLLPMISNQKMNEYLKDIARDLNIHKPLSFHSARHTFATTVTLQNGVPIESVSRMLGHKSIKTTQIYARIVDKKVEEDMDQLSLRIGSKFGQKPLNLSSIIISHSER